MLIKAAMNFRALIKMLFYCTYSQSSECNAHPTAAHRKADLYPQNLSCSTQNEWIKTQLILMQITTKGRELGTSKTATTQNWVLLLGGGHKQPYFQSFFPGRKSIPSRGKGAAHARAEDAAFLQTELMENKNQKYLRDADCWFLLTAGGEQTDL